MTGTHCDTADLPFGHDSIIPNANRPFRDTSHMDSVLIGRLWTKTGSSDGDWRLSIFSQLPGGRVHRDPYQHARPRGLKRGM